MAASLKKDINPALKNLTTLIELEQICKKAKQKINFWGYRHLTFEGYKGTTSIYKIQEKLNLILDNSYKIDQDKVKEVRRFILILAVANFERKTNIITRIMLVIRDFFYKLTAAGHEVHSELKKFIMKQKEDKFLETVRTNVREQIIHEVRNEMRREMHFQAAEVLDASRIIEGEPSDGTSTPDSPKLPRRNVSPVPGSTSDPV